MHQCFSPEFEDRTAQLSEALADHEIKAFCCDLDDTFLHTHDEFVAGTDEFKDALCANHGLERDLLNAEFDRLNLAVHATWSVSPDRWEPLVAELGGIYKVGDGFMEHLPLLLGIYDKVPKVKEGSFEFLEMLLEANQKIATVTHANEPWTWFKLQHTGLIKYFKPVIIADERRHKSVDDWKRGLVELGIPGWNAINVGDNIRGDIIAGFQAGFRYQVHVPATWSFYAEGELPQTAFSSPLGIAGVADVLIAKLR